MQCVILAGGLGTRMAHVTGTGPKALIPVRGIPFAAYQLEHLAREGITRVVYSIGHRGELIRDFAGDGSAWGLSVQYLEDGPELLGTAGALRKGLDQGLVDSPFLVMYGDSFLPIRFAPVVRAFERSKLPALITVYRNEDKWDRSNVLYEQGIVRLYDKRSERRAPGMLHIEYGLSVLAAGALEEGALSGVSPADLADVFHALSVRGRLAAHEVTQRFYEIGSPGGLEDLERYLLAEPRSPTRLG